MYLELSPSVYRCGISHTVPVKADMPVHGVLQSARRPLCMDGDGGSSACQKLYELHEWRKHCGILSLPMHI